MILPKICAAWSTQLSWSQQKMGQQKNTGENRKFSVNVPLAQAAINGQTGIKGAKSIDFFAFFRARHYFFLQWLQRSDLVSCFQHFQKIAQLQVAITSCVSAFMPIKTLLQRTTAAFLLREHNIWLDFHRVHKNWLSCQKAEGTRGQRWKMGRIYQQQVAADRETVCVDMISEWSTRDVGSELIM